MKSKLEITVKQLRAGVMLCSNDADVKEFLTREGRLDDLLPIRDCGDQVSCSGETPDYYWTAVHCYDRPGDEGYVLCLGDKKQISEETFRALMLICFLATRAKGSPLYAIERTEKGSN